MTLSNETSRKSRAFSLLAGVIALTVIFALGALYWRVNDMDREYGEIARDKVEYERTRDAALQERQVLRETNATLQIERLSLRDEVAALETDKFMLSGETKLQRDAIVETEQRLSTLKGLASAAQITINAAAELRTDVTDLETNRNELKRLIAREKSNSEALRDQKSRLESDKLILSDQVTDLSDNVEVLRQQQNDLQQAVLNLSALKTNVSQLGNEETSLISNIQQKRAELRAVRSESDNAEIRMNGLDGLILAARDTQQDFQNKIGGLTAKRAGLEQEVINLESQRGTLVAEALSLVQQVTKAGEDLDKSQIQQASLLSKQGDLRDSVDQLKIEKSELETIASDLSAKQDVEQAQLTALQVNRSELNSAISALMEDQRARATQSDLDQNALISVQSEAETVLQEIAELTKERDLAQAQKETLKTDNDDLSKDVSRLGIKKLELEVAVGNFTAAQEVLAAQNEDAEDDLKSTQARTVRLRLQISDLTTNLGDLWDEALSLDGLESRRTALQEKLTSQTTALAALKVDSAEKINELDNTQARLTSKRSALGVLTAELPILLAERDRSKDELERLQQQISDLKIRAAEFAANDESVGVSGRIPNTDPEDVTSGQPANLESK